MEQMNRTGFLTVIGPLDIVLTFYLIVWEVSQFVRIKKKKDFSDTNYYIFIKYRILLRVFIS